MGRGDEEGRQISTATDRDRPSSSVSYVKSICSSASRPFLFPLLYRSPLPPPSQYPNRSPAIYSRAAHPTSLSPSLRYRFVPRSPPSLSLSLSSHLRRWRLFRARDIGQQRHEFNARSQRSRGTERRFSARFSGRSSWTENGSSNLEGRPDSMKALKTKRWMTSTAHPYLHVLV